MPGTDRRHSTSSEDANAPARQLSQDGTEIIPTRMSKVTTPKPASNPLQFIKTGPCDLYKAAQEQIKKVEEIKKVEKVKDESEDWQSNLDNWKCSRRKRQEHIIERVVEVKKLELEEHDRNRRRSKTFNEMMEERNSKGGLRKMSIFSYSEDDDNDLSDLGISTNKEKSSGDSSGENQSENGANGDYHDHADEETSNGHKSHIYDEESSTPATISSPEPEEYTYERAIQGYMSFAEAKVKSPIKTATERKGLNGNVGKKEPGGKIGEKLSELEQIRLRSKSSNDLNGGIEGKQLPKVDVHKRRSLFENAEALESVNVKSAERLPKEFSNSKSIKERLSNLEKNNESVAKVNRLSGEVSPSIKETISNLEKQKSGEGGKRLSNGDVSPQISIKERLSSLEKHGEVESSKTKSPCEEISQVSIKERMSSFDSKEPTTTTTSATPPAKLTPERDAGFKEKLENFKSTDKNQNDVNSITGNHSPNNCSDSKQNRCLDRLDAEEVGKEEEEEEKKTEEQEAVEEKVEEPKPVLEVLKTESLQDSVPVSSCREDGLVVVEGENCGAEVKETEEETTNTEVEGPETRCDISETIEISLPNAQVPCPRVNISVSVDSSTKEPSADSEEEEGGESHDEFPDEFPPSGLRGCITLSKPKTRVRKLTPMISNPKIPISPLKTVCELQIIEEGESGNASPPSEGKKKGEEGGGERGSQGGGSFIAVHMNPTFYETDNEVQDMAVKTASSKMEEDGPDDPQEESGEYTDENIDEVLGKEEEEEDVETCVDEVVTDESKIQKELEIFTPKEAPEVISVPSLKSDISEKPLPVSANYENVFITNQVPQLSMSPDSDIYATLSFPLGSRPSIEPPKEKPPPPPLELSDDESNKPELPPKPSLRRLDSTKRIKKEIRKKRSDFLGIEGTNDDSYLEPEIYVAPPPDMMTFLQEERRLEQQLYRQSICSESDSNHETAESRDSGVELDRGHVDDICWSKPDVLSEPHSRQNSETFGNTSITSEEDEILKKEREIIEVLEKEEQWRYGNKNSNNAEQNDIGEKLAVKLHQLEQEKMQLERERAEEESRRKAEESARRQNEQRLIAKQQQLREQENSTSHSNTETSNDQEALRFERERLQKEQEHLERCRQNLIKQQQQQNPEPIEIMHRGNISHWDTPSSRHSLQEVPVAVPMQDVPRHSMQDVSQPPYQPPPMTSGYRYSLPDLQQREPRSARPPPPIPPAKPTRPLTQEQWERETNIRNSRIPSADNIPLQIETSSKLRHGSSVPAININHGGQQMTRSTLHALSAAPRSRIISNENWMQPKRKVDAPKNNYNYQHWLIQEAEHRRIIEHQQKVSQQLQPKRTLPYNGQSPANYVNSPPSHHTVGLPISPPMQGQPNQRWISPPRQDKPLPDAVIQTLTQRVQSRENKTPPRRRLDNPGAALPNKMSPPGPEPHPHPPGQSQERMLSVSGKKKCSHCNEELGRGAAMIIESLRLFYHIDCFKCCVCHVQLGDGLMGTDVRVRNNKLHCHNCYSSDDDKEEDGEEDEEEEKLEFIHCQVIEEESDESLSPLTVETVTSSDSLTSDGDIFTSIEFLDLFPEELIEDLPTWFQKFYKVYQTNENRKFILMQKMHLEMIDFEIRKCELLKDIIDSLKE